MKFNRQRLTLDQVMEMAGICWSSEPWITFDPDVTPQYQIIRQQSHDGNLHFTERLAREALRTMLSQTSYCKDFEPPKSGQAVSYTVGEIWLCTVYGIVGLPAGRCRGQRERIIIPVKCEYK